MNDLSFAQWMQQIDRILLERFDITTADIGDCCYRDMYDDELTPEEAADEAVDNDDMGWMLQ